MSNAVVDDRLDIRAGVYDYTHGRQAIIVKHRALRGDVRRPSKQKSITEDTVIQWSSKGI